MGAAKVIKYLVFAQQLPAPADLFGFAKPLNNQSLPDPQFATIYRYL
jgi:hypothetical protein